MATIDSGSCAPVWRSNSVGQARPDGMPGVDQGASPISWTAWLAELDRQQLALRVTEEGEIDYEFVERKSLN